MNPRHLAFALACGSTFSVLTAAEPNAASVAPGAGLSVPRAGSVDNASTTAPASARIQGASPEATLELTPQAPLRAPLRRSPILEGMNLMTFDDSSSYQLTDYSNPPSSLLSLNGQLSPEGLIIGADPWVGAATDAVMMSVPPGSPGGVPPQGNLLSTSLPPGQYIALARASGQDSLTTAFTTAMTRRFASRMLSSVAPLIVAEDWYLTSAETSQWWSPITFLEGGTWDRVFFGGTNLTGGLGVFSNESGVLDRFVSLGLIGGNPAIGAFYAAPRDPELPFPVEQWFILADMQAADASGRIGQGLWLKTQDSIVNGFLDPRMAAGDLLASDGDPIGWVNLYPGLVDDPDTPLREGVGIARNIFNQPASTSGLLSLAPPTSFLGHSALFYGEGLDPIGVPSFQPADAFIDNTTTIGTPFDGPDFGPDGIIPFLDDFELYQLGLPIRVQGWFGGIAQADFVIASPTGVGQALAQAPFRNAFLVLREAASVQFAGTPTSSAPEQPSVASALFHFPAGSMGETRVFEASAPGSSSLLNDRPAVAAVVLGAVDPSVDAGADGMVWVEQPNPDFNPAQDWQDHLVERHWKPSTEWTSAPADAPLNTRFILTPTFTPFPIGESFEVRLTVELDSPGAAPTLRVHVDDVEVFPNGDPSRRFLAGGARIDALRLFTASADGSTSHSTFVDDIQYDAPIRAVADGPSFNTPYVDSFEAYPAHDTVDGQGATPFLSPSSVPVIQSSFLDRILTLIADSGASPREGELVCRYLVNESFLLSGLVTVDDIVAVPHDDLPPTFQDGPTGEPDCPGSSSFEGQFVIRPAPNEPRLETGRWTRLNETPEPFNEASGDITGFRFDTFNEPRWVAPIENASVTVAPSDQALGAEGSSTDQLLEIRIAESVDGAPSGHPMFTALTSILPAAEAAPEMNFANPERRVALAFDLYIESLDERGAPDDSLPPRSRFSVPLMGVGADGGRVTTIMFGGPHVNQNFADHFNPPIGVLPPDAISVAVPSGFFFPIDVMFQPTGVSLLTGGAGIDGSISGPLVNRWIRVIAEVNADSEWTIAIDEDRDGPLSPVTIASGVALDQDESGFGGMTLNTSGLDGFNINVGRDLGSGGQPAPRRARIVTVPGEELAAAPPNADPLNDYCFYEVTAQELLDGVPSPQVAVPDQFSGVITQTRPLQGHDILAVLNRQVDGAGMVVGARIHERCPWDIASGVNRFDVLEAGSGDVRFQGSWSLLGRVGLANLSNPAPAGGIAHIDGPAQNPPIAYNDPSLAPPDYPQLPAARPILLATWNDDEHDGWDPMPPVFPAQRWLIDNVRLEEIESAPPCPDLGGDPGVIDGSDLAQLLASWGTVVGETGADLNGDGVVNGADLATLLANWGPCD